MKIRGFRIELEEIESALRQNPLVREAVVVAREIRGEQMLIAYFVPYPAVQVDHESLRTQLKAHMPDYMVPANFVELKSMPLSPNGKVDRRALPEPDLAPARTEYLAPRNEVEEKLARIWCDVLRLEKAGVHDNFFDLGGHSLLATQLVSRIRTTFGVQIPLSRFFEKPTIAEIGSDLQQAEGRPPSPAPMRAGKVDDLSDEDVERLLRQHLGA